MEIPKGDDRLAFFQELLNRSNAARDDAFNDIEKWRKQYTGDPAIDGGEKAKVVRNITYELIESQISTHIPAPRVDAKVYSERNDRGAKSIERLCATIRNDLPFERLNDQDERNTFVDGASVYLVEWDESIRTHSECGGVRVTVLEADGLYPQPGIYEIRDMDWVILRFQSTKDEIIAKYHVAPDVAEEAENDAIAETQDEDICTVYVCFYKNSEDQVSQYIWSGNTQLADIDDYYARKRYVCAVCGRRRELCESFEHCDCGGEFIAESEEYEEITRDVVLPDGFTIPARSPKYDENGAPVMRKVTRIRTDSHGEAMHELIEGVSIPMTYEDSEQDVEVTRIPWYRPRFFPVVVRKNTSRRRSVLGQSDCYFIRPQQQEINKIETRIHEKIMGSGVYPFKPEDAAFEFDDTVQTRVLNVPPEYMNAAGRVFGVLDMMPNLQQEIAQSDRLYEHAKRILGITNSYQGQADTTAKSGVAKQAQIQQAAGRLDSKRVMKNAAYSDLDRILFEYHLAYADEPRPIAYKDAFGRMQNSTFNRYDFVRYDEEGHRYYYEDRFLFSVDQNGGADTQREVLWQLNQQNFSAGVYGDPAQIGTLLRYWQMQEQAHYPHARENVEYFTELLERERAAMNDAVGQGQPAPGNKMMTGGAANGI
ncbi:MAG: hypothetical protein E7590_00955 [Ruminococcaceae bacterium]|nr:hypothetical protein [Oscillospiraceae bacterium]